MSRLTLETPDNAQNTADGLGQEFGRRVVTSPPGVCPVELQLSYLKVCHAQTCGKCTPCRIGLGQIEYLMEDVLNGKATMETLTQIEQTARVVKNSADCAIGVQTADRVLKGFYGFKEDFIAHVTTKRCSAEEGQAVPCVTRCPAHVDIPGYIALTGAQRYADAVKVIRKDNPFPTACALICEHPCEERCRRNMIDSAVNIRGLKRMIVDNVKVTDVLPPACAKSTGKCVAIVGGGPSGLTAAYYLQLMGHQVTVFEEKNQLGGMLRYGIPNYRFPRKRLQDDIDVIVSTGIEIRKNIVIGKDVTMEHITATYDAVYVAIGAHSDKRLGIEGEEAKGVISAVDLLRDIGDGQYPDFTGKRVVVVGGGNVAMDCARTAIRSKSESVSIVYRRRQKDMTALPAEVEGAIAEGIELLTLRAPIRVEKDASGKVCALWVQPQMSGAYDRGRPKPIKADKDMVRIPCDVVLVAVGQEVDSASFAEFGMETKWNCFVTDDAGKANKEGIYAGGDCVSGPSTVIKAIAAGKIAAANIDEYLGYHHPITCDVEIPQPRLNDKVPTGRIHLADRAANVRKHDFEAIECGMSDEEAYQESGRCLRCDHYGCATLRGGRETQW